MAKSPKNGKLLYHLTSVDNLRSILTHGLQARDSIKDFVDVADKEIINHREEKGLNNLVPFHFFGANPFDGAVQIGHPDKKFVFITLRRVFAKENDFKILPRHPLSLDDCTLLDYDKGIEEINWELMEQRDYNNHECKEICMAECLSESKINAINFHTIYVPDEKTKELVENLRQEIFKNPDVFNIEILNSIFVK